MKQIKWNIHAREFVRSLDNETKREIGTLLMLLQNGVKLREPQAKSIKVVHQGAYELRIKDRKGIYRVIYVLALGEKILIPHAFMKKTQKTPLREIEVSRKRLKELLDEKNF